MLATVVPRRVVLHGVTHTSMETDPRTRTLGQLIENYRLDLGLTKAEAARLAGVSRGTWHAVENGTRTNMLADTLNLFDKALGLPRGTLRNASVHGVLPTTLGGVLGPPSNTPVPVDGDDTELRWRLVQYAVTMPSEEIRRVALFINGSDNGYQKWLRAELRTLLQEEPLPGHPVGGAPHDDTNIHRDPQLATGA